MKELEQGKKPIELPRRESGIRDRKNKRFSTGWPGIEENKM